MYQYNPNNIVFGLDAIPFCPEVSIQNESRVYMQIHAHNIATPTLALPLYVATTEVIRRLYDKEGVSTEILPKLKFTKEGFSFDFKRDELALQKDISDNIKKQILQIVDRDLYGSKLDILELGKYGIIEHLKFSGKECCGEMKLQDGRLKGVIGYDMPYHAMASTTCLNIASIEDAFIHYNKKE